MALALALEAGLVAASGPPALGGEEPKPAAGSKSSPGADGDARARPSALAVRVEHAPRIDGRLGDEAWTLAPEGGRLTQVVPVEGAAPSERTEFRVAYDDRALYLAVRCFDREPEKILARELTRDGPVYRDDFVTIFLDPFHDHRNGYLFSVNPNGARLDFLISNNTEADSNWDGVWSAAGAINAEGWAVEIEIPFDSIASDPEADAWGLNVSRFIARKNERCRWSRPLQNVWSYMAAEAGDLGGIRGVKSGLGLEVVPYALARARDDRPSNDGDLAFRSGGDLRYRITPRLAARLSVNTEFAETEVDERQVNLTRFPLFFPEKRDFFLEDSGIFNFGGLGPELLPYHSRRIGLSAGGEPEPIALAGKLTGRAGPYNLGLVDALLGEHGDLGMRNVAVGRLSRNVLEQSTVGVIASAGDPSSERDSFLGGADLGYRTTSFRGADVLEAKAFGLATRDGEGGDGDPFAFGAEAGLPNDLYQAKARFYQVGDDFRPALGFVPRRAIRAYSGSAGYSPRPAFLPVVRQLRFGYASTHITDLEDRLETAEHVFTPLGIELETGDDISLEARYDLDAPREPFEIHRGVVIAPGSYEWPSASVGFSTVNTRLASLAFRYSFGGFYTGVRDGYALLATLRPVKYLGLEVRYSLDDVRLPEGDFQTRLALARVRLSFTADLGWSHLVQYDDVTDTIGYHSRVRWEFRPGSTLYLVVDQNLERNHGRLRALESELTLKIEASLRF